MKNTISKRVLREIIREEIQNLNELLVEYASKSTIVVDVQPAYEKYIRFDMDKFSDFLNKQKSILYFFNGPDLGNEAEMDVMYWLMDYGVDDDTIDRIKFIDKGYGFFRNWMDVGVGESTIQKAIIHMVKNRKYDSRDIDEDEWLEMFPELENYDVLDDGIYLPDISIGKLKNWSGSYLCGGGKDECLKEVQLLMNAFNIKYKLVREFIY